MVGSNRFYFEITVAFVTLLIAIRVGTTSSFFGIASGVSAASFVAAVYEFFNGWRTWRPLLTASLLYSRKDLRVSISGLVKIRIQDKYLLIKGKRINQFQPIGGVFKILPNESSEFFSQLNITNDQKMPIDNISDRDLRVHIKGSKFPEFFKWYSKAGGRESNPWREFFEELVVPGYLESPLFGYAYFRHIRQKIVGPRFSDHFQCNEILIAEIFELEPTTEQSKVLRQLVENCPDSLIWTDIDSIKALGFSKENSLGLPISPTAAWTL